MHVATARPAAFLMAVLVWVWPSSSASQQAQKLTPKDAAKMVAETDKLAAEGRLAEARERLSTVVQQDPTNASAALKLGRICQSLQDWDCALTGYQIAVANVQGVEKAEAQAGLAAAHLRRARYQDAAENARAAIASNPSLAAAYVTLAASLVRLRAGDALAAAQKALEVAPTEALAHATLGEALARQGRSAEGEPLLRKALELDPKTAEAHAGLAEIQYGKGDLDGTIASATRALELDSRFGHLYVLRGRAHDGRGNQQAALADLQQAVTVQPQDAAAHLVLGEIHRKRQSLDLAFTHYRSAVAIDGQFGDAYLGLGDILVMKREFDAAREPVERAATLLPQSARAQYLLGVLREERRQFDEAILAFERATALDPKLAPAHHGLGRLLRAHRKDPAGAVASLEKAVALNPENPEVLTDLAVALYDTKRGDRAIQLLQKAIASPGYKNALGFGVLGLALKDQQAFGEALGHFEKAVELQPKWWLPHWGAAWSHFGLIKKGCPCGPEDEERVKKMKAHFDLMTSLEGKDPALGERVAALLKGQKIK